MARSKLLLPLAVVGLLVCLSAPSNVSAQDILGTLVGSIRDASGAVVVGAAAKLTNEGTRIVRTATTNSTGAFEFLKLEAGSYTLEVSQTGFRRYLQTGLTINAAATQSVDVTLQVGAVTQTVEVRSNVKMVETVSMQQGGTMPAQLIQNLPTLNLNWTNLALLFPGSQDSPDRLGNSFNGARSVANNFLVNGVDANDTALNTVLITPSPDTIQEFRLITNTMNPEYGRNSGSLMEVVTKSGTNLFHGTAFWFHRDKGLNARDFFDTRKPDFNRNQWGGTVGGPIWKDHTFFFFDLQSFNQKIPARASLSPNDPQVLSPAERTGDFSADRAFSGTSPNIPPFNGRPWSQVLAGNRIDPSFFNPISKFYLDNFVPPPNLSGNRFSSVGASPFKSDRPGQWGLKIDHHRPKDTISGSFFWREETQSRPFPFTGANVPGFGDLRETHVRQFSLTHTRTLSPSVVNEARYGYSRLWFRTVFPDPSLPGNKPPSAFGFKGVTPQDSSVASSPKITIGDTLVLGFSNNGPQPRVDDTHQVTESLSWLHGRHSFKAGVEYRHARVFTNFRNSLNGVFDFGGAGDFSTSNGFADFLMGIPDSYTQGSGSILDARNDIWYAYAQDVFKATPRLTFTYGTSWTLDLPWENIFNQNKSMIAFLPGCHSTVYPTAPVGICYTGDPGIPRGTAPLRKKNFGPRFGFAWNPDTGSGLLSHLAGGAGKFVLRGGYGIYRDNIIGESTLQFLGNPPIGLTISGAKNPSFSTPFTAIDGSSSRPTPFPVAPAPPIGSNVDFSLYEPITNISSFDPNFRVAYTQSFNLTLERQFSDNWLVRLGYVGSLGRNLLSTYEGNPVNSALAAQRNCGRLFTQVNCPFVTRFIPGDIVASVAMQGSFANSSYHSFQTEVQKRLSRGVSFQASYTLSKSLDNSNGLEGDASAFQTVNPFDPGRDRAFSEFDARHRFVLSYLWDLPGRKTGALGKVVGGWRFSGITSFATGFPVFLTDTSDRCLIGLAEASFGTYCRPDLVGAIRLFDPRDNAAVGQNLKNPRGVAPSNAFFDPTALRFVPLNSGLFGTAPRSIFHGPGINNFDLGVQKDIHFTERLYLTPRFEFFNAWNHAQFQNPSGNVNSVAFARVTRTRAQVGRIIQMGLKLTF